MDGLDGALKRYVELKTGVPAGDIEQVSTYDDFSSGCDTCGHGSGYDFTISYVVNGKWNEVMVYGDTISEVLNELLEV